MHALLTLVALACDAAFGYPRWLFERIGHPVSWVGRLIARCEQAWNGRQLSFARRRLNGMGTLLVCLTATGAVSVAIQVLVVDLAPPYLQVLLLGAAGGTLLAQRSLYEHVSAVAVALEHGGIEEGRRAVSLIVGRDAAPLDEAGVCRAAIESLAENFSDGVVAPAFWLLVGGLPGCALYKAVNTADSMIGHRNDRYLAFGWAAARLDDLANLPASRLAALWLVAAALVGNAGDARDAASSVLRDARHHRSPNAGWPEAAMAGALGLRLAGPRVYGGVPVPDRWMGSGRAEAGPKDIRRALGLYRTACLLQAAALALLAMALSG
jgi:adenosylcobinamide-phosphate synthase